MKETEVVKAVRNWIKSDHPNWIIRRAWHFDVVGCSSEDKPSIAVECKGHLSKRHEVHRAIGQCLDYMTFTKVSCFIAIPEDCVYKDVIVKTLENHRLPIGLLTVTDNGEVTVLRQVKKSDIGE